MGQLKLYTTDLGQVDLYRVENNLQPAKDKNDTGQKVLLRSSTNKGEYPYNFSYGLDFVGSILAQKPVPSKSTIAALINESLLSIEGVLKVNPLDFYILTKMGIF